MMTERTPKIKHTAAVRMFPMLLFFVFLLCTIFTILIGSRVYENIRARNSEAFHTDTALAYMTNKVRQNDRAGSVSIREDGGCRILVLASAYDDVEFETWIYRLDGQLMELFTAKDSGIGVESGQKIMDCAPVDFSLEDKENGDRILTIAIEGSRETNLLLRSSSEKKGDSEE